MLNKVNYYRLFPVETLIIDSNKNLQRPDLLRAYITPATLEAKLFVLRVMFDGYLEYHVSTLYSNDIYTRHDNMKKEVLECLSIIQQDSQEMIDDYVIKLQPTGKDNYKQMLGRAKRAAARKNIGIEELGPIISMDGKIKPAFTLTKRN